jgi:hypothetical protein
MKLKIRKTPSRMEHTPSFMNIQQSKQNLLEEMIDISYRPIYITAVYIFTNKQ